MEQLFEEEDEKEEEEEEYEYEDEEKATEVEEQVQQVSPKTPSKRVHKCWYWEGGESISSTI